MEDLLDDDDEIEEYADKWGVSEEQTRKIVKEWIAYMEEYEELKVTDGYKVKGKFILKSEGNEYETDYMEFEVLKINGTWVYMGLLDYNYLWFEGDDTSGFTFFFDYLLYPEFYRNSWF